MMDFVEMEFKNMLELIPESAAGNAVQELVEQMQAIVRMEGDQAGSHKTEA